MSVQSYGNPAFRCSPPGALPSSAGVLLYSLNKLRVSYRKKKYLGKGRKEGYTKRMQGGMNKGKEIDGEKKDQVLRPHCHSLVSLRLLFKAKASISL